MLPPQLAADLIYVSVAEEKRIAIYHVNATDTPKNCGEGQTLPVPCATKEVQLL